MPLFSATGLAKRFGGRVVLQDGDAIVFFDGAPQLQLLASASAELLRFDTAAVDPRTGLIASPSLHSSI